MYVLHHAIAKVLYILYNDIDPIIPPPHISLFIY